MKKVIAIILIICFTCLFLSSCGSNYVIQGLENFSVNTSSVGLCDGLIPDNFIEMFTYKDGNYFLSMSEKMPGFEVCERAFMYLQYDDDVYLMAKQYAMENLALSDDMAVQHNDYIFYDNDVDSNKFPYSFKRFAYNDSNNTLIFIGFDVSMELYSDVDEAIGDWGGFLEKYYGEFYTFS